VVNLVSVLQLDHKVVNEGLNPISKQGVHIEIVVVSILLQVRCGNSGHIARGVEVNSSKAFPDGLL
jgi:hypothetical protein